MSYVPDRDKANEFCIHRLGERDCILRGMGRIEFVLIGRGKNAMDTGIV